MSSSNDRETVIWDLPTRVFHWSLVVLVGTNLFLISPKGGLYTVSHFVAGFSIAGLLLFRLFWGFIGSPRSRFADFLRPWPVVKGYIERLRRFDPPHSVGHNPLGGWMIIVLLSALLAMIATGVFAAGPHAAGPLAGLVSVSAAALAGKVHSLISNVLIALIVLHLAGVAVDWLLTRDNLVKAMLTGRKRLPAQLAQHEGRVAPIWRAMLLGFVCLALVAGLALSTDYTRTRTTLTQTMSQL